MSRLVKAPATIHVEKHTLTPQHIEFAEIGINNVYHRMGLQAVVNTIEYPYRSYPEYRNSGQVSTAILAGHECWQGGGLNVWATGRDLTSYDGSVNYAFGVAGHDGHVVVSSHRLDLEDPHNPTEFLTVVTHESGHAMGLVDPRKPNHDSRYGFGGHCNQSCTMEAANNRNHIIESRNRLLNNIGSAGFCGYCLYDLAKRGHDIRNS